VKLDHELVAWWLFLISAVLFVVVAVRAGDVVAVLAAIAFLAACVVYLVGRRLGW